MLNIKSRILVLLGVVLIISGMFGVSQVFAQANNGKNTSFVQELALKLGIDQVKVQQAVDQIRQGHKSQTQTRFSDLLDQAVKDGKITEAQKQLILDKRQELQNTKLNFKDMTPEQKRQAMQKQKQQLEEWSKQNNIDLKYLLGGHGALGGFKGRLGRQK